MDKRKLAIAKRPNDLTICTFLWGSWYGKGVEYVNKLYRGIERNLTIPHQFRCFTDRVRLPGADKGIKLLPIPPNVMNWRRNLKKLIMFAPDNDLSRWVLAIDLDVVITGSLDDIVCWRGEFITCDSVKSSGKMGGTLIGFYAGWGEDLLWNYFLKNPWIADEVKGSERKLYRLRIGKYNLWQREIPNQVYHYRSLSGTIEKRLPLNARIVYFTGQPKPHQVQEGWVKEYWI